MISLDSVSKSFAGEYAILDVSFEVNKGDILGFLGPNGAGKTTTMRIITGCLAPTSGSVTINGKSLLKNPVEIKRLIGYMPENNPLYTDLTVSEYLRFRGKIKEIRGKELKKRLEYVLSTCMLEKVRHKLVGTLSKGFRQRVGLADTLIHDPSILVLDEPTVGLDPAQIKQVRELISSIGEDRTVILSTHILSEVESTCNRVVIINDGRIQAMDTAEHLSAMHNAGSAVLTLEIKNNTGSFEKDLKQSDILFTVQESGNDQNIYTIRYTEKNDIREHLFNLAVKNHSVILQMSKEKTTLEDVFIRLVSDEVKEEKQD
ncbi:MAG: ATP-binding cassette domain-containing protein [Candidatus Auribacter fodinae]|jgi:ABC-2 type transport system ATP-binding protein|uniref:ATP-binding cassette domain-containing protein n=1 Tax=Candidatus Auribacter fodinae TaxID=2093366 RepID=A0A3A4QZ61_9BACT|nr:MAG: ATP-binding cassette domain-containing protein [Candidatus Auribacter fodinae]